MKKYKVETREIKVIDKEFCDKCGEEIIVLEDYSLDTNIKLTYLYSAWGDSWYEYGWKIDDLCLECMKKLEKLLIENNYKIQRMD